MSRKLGYLDALKIFSPGRVVAGASHPVLENLGNPYFKKILTQTDQAILVLNHTNFQYEYVSDNVCGITGYTAQEFIAGGAELSFKLIHSDDVHILNAIVYPAFYESLYTIPRECWTSIQQSQTYRVRRKDGKYIQALQRCFPISFEGDKILLGLLVVSDISAYKKDNKVLYRNVLLEKGEPPVVLSFGATDEPLFPNASWKYSGFARQALLRKKLHTVFRSAFSP